MSEPDALVYFRSKTVFPSLIVRTTGPRVQAVATARVRTANASAGLDTWIRNGRAAFSFVTFIFLVSVLLPFGGHQPPPPDGHGPTSTACTRWARSTRAPGCSPARPQRMSFACLYSRLSSRRPLGARRPPNARILRRSRDRGKWGEGCRRGGYGMRMGPRSSLEMTCAGFAFMNGT